MRDALADGVPNPERVAVSVAGCDSFPERLPFPDTDAVAIAITDNVAFSDRHAVSVVLADFLADPDAFRDSDADFDSVPNVVSDVFAEFEWDPECERISQHVAVAVCHEEPGSVA